MRTSLFSVEECQAIAEKKLKTKKFQVLNFELEPLGDDKEQGFMGYYYHFKITVQIQDSPDVINLQFFCKHMRDNYGDLSGSEVYGKEIKFYSKIFYDLMDVQLKLNGRSNLNKAVCQSYLVRDNAIVLEDLYFQGFRPVSVRETLDVDHCKVVLQGLAYFHAASVIREETLTKDTGKIVRIVDEHPEEMFKENIFSRVGSSGFYKTSQHLIWKLLEVHPIYGTHHVDYEVICEKLSDFFEEIYDLCLSSKKYRNVICHGDLWATNLLYRYEDKKPVEVRFVDYQILRFAPPASDVMTFLHLATTREFRQLHGENLLEFYHQEFSKELKNFRIQPDDVIPWTEFRESCSYLEPVGIVITSCYYPGDLVKNIRSHLRKEEDYISYIFKDRGLALKEYETDQILRDRTIDVLTSLVEVCLSWKK